MGIQAKYTASITKVCDGCGESWEAHAKFSSVAGVLSFGGPAEAAGWEIHVRADGGANLLCEKCAEHCAKLEN